MNKQGWIFTYTHHNGQIGIVVELQCETDFAAKTDEFQSLGHELCLQVAAMGDKFLLAQNYVKDDSMKVAVLVEECARKLKEDVRIGKVVRVSII